MHIVDVKMNGTKLVVSLETAQTPTAPREGKNRFPLWGSGGFIRIPNPTPTGPDRVSLNAIRKGE